MNEAFFQLHPFPGETTPSVTLEAKLRRRHDSLLVCYLLSGDRASLAIPSPARVPARRERLWDQSCFELFFGEPGSPGYWEVNLSPAGHWNVYAFDSYRTNMRPEGAVAALPFSVVRQTGFLTIIAELDLAGIMGGGLSLGVGMSSVLREKTGGKSHWAPAHAAGQPDFHRRETFLARLEP